jgi:hypothetical protein
MRSGSVPKILWRSPRAQVRSNNNQDLVLSTRGKALLELGTQDLYAKVSSIFFFGSSSDYFGGLCSAERLKIALLSFLKII